MATSKWMVGVSLPDHNGQGPRFLVAGLYDSEPQAHNNRPDNNYSVVPVTVEKYTAAPETIST